MATRADAQWTLCSATCSAAFDGCIFVLENNKPPQADAGPDKELTLPVDSTTLDGSKSTDDQRVVSYLWEQSR